MSDFSKFRTAVSGFNRTDVVNYIESTSIEHQKALRKLTDERDKLAAENARLQVELAGLQKRLEQAQADNDALSGQVNALAQEGSDLAEQLKKAEEAQQELLTRPDPQPSEPVPQPEEPEESEEPEAAHRLRQQHRKKAGSCADVQNPQMLPLRQKPFYLTEPFLPHFIFKLIFSHCPEVV